MIMQNKKLFLEDMSQFERIMNEVRLQFFALMNMVVEANFVSPYLYRILMVVETLQLAFFSIHSRLNFIWDSSFVQAAQNLTKNIQFQGILDNRSGKVMMPLLILCFTVNFIMFILLLVSGYSLQKIKKRQSLGALTYSLKLLSFYGILVKTILPLPFIDIFLNGLLCSSSKFPDIKCFDDSLYFIYSAMSVIGLILQIFFSFVFSIMMTDMNPFSRLPFASIPTFANELRLLVKILLSFYLALDFKIGIQVTLVIILTIIYLILCLIDYHKVPFFDRITSVFQVAADSSLLWISFSSSVQGIITSGSATASSQNISAIFLFFGIPFTAILIQSLHYKKQDKLLQLFAEEIKKPDDMEAYALLVIKLILNRSQRSNYIKLEGILHLHSDRCKLSPDICPCSLLLLPFKKQEENQANNLQFQSKSQFDDQQKQWFLFLKSSIQVILKKYNKCSKIHMLISYLDHEKLKLKFKSLTEMMTSEMFKPTLREKFSLYRHKFLIELDIIDTDMRNEQNKNVDVNGIVHFENMLVVFLKSIETSVNLHLEFWRELLEDSPDIEKLQIVGSRITNTIEDAKLCFNNLCIIRQNNIRSLLIYGNFLKEVVNDEVESIEHLEKAAYVSKSSVVNKQFADNENMKYSENSNTGILTMSANLDTRFYIQNANYDFSRILGWPKHEVVDQNIKNHIMPKLISSIHDGLVSHYIDTSIPKAIGCERLITPTNKDGFLVPSVLMIKILPNLEDGLQFVGFFKEKDEIYCAPYVRTDNVDDDVIHYLLYKVDENLSNQTIIGITQSVNDRFGIPTSLVNNNSPMSNQFTIDLICPLLANPQTLEDIQSEAGALIEMDTTIIEQLFLISQESEPDEKQVFNFEIPNSVNNNNELSKKNGSQSLSNSKKNQLNMSANKSSIKSKFSEYQEQQLQQSQQQQQEHQMHKEDDTVSASVGIGEEVKRYRKSQINVWLEEEFVYKDTVLNIIKFIEVNSEQEPNEENEELMNLENLNEEKNNELMNENEDGLNHNEDDDHHQQQQQVDEEGNQSNISSNSQDYEELRQLKDIKSAITEKTKPKTIRILQNSVVLVCLLLFILVIIDLVYKFDEVDQMSAAINAIYYGYQRHSTMADINFLTRKVWFLSNGYITTSSASQKEALGITIKKTLEEKVILLNQIEFNLQKAQMAIEKREGKDLSELQISIKTLLPNGNILTSLTNFTDSLNVYMAESGGLSNTTLSNYQDSLSTATSITATKSNFYSVNYNGIYSLRVASQEMAEVYFNYYYDDISSFNTAFLLIMVFAILVLGISQFVLLPIVFSVQKTNAIVLSFFAIVPTPEIQLFATKCEKFLRIFIERKQSQEEDMEEGENRQNNIDNKNAMILEDGDLADYNDANKSKFMVGQSPKNTSKDRYVIQNNNHDNNASYIQNQSAINPNNQSVNASYLPATQQQDQQLLGSKLQSSKKNQPTVLELQKIQLQKEEDERRYEQEENQRHKILNAKDNKKRIVVVQFIALTLLLMMYFIINYSANEMAFQSSIKSLLQHTKQTRSRSSLLKYYFTFIEESVVNLTPLLDISSTSSLQSIYSLSLQENDDLITTSFKASFPTQFSSYKSLFSNINFDSLCTYSTITVTSLSCSSVSTLSNGLQRVVTQIGVDGNSILAKIQDFSTSSSTKTAYIQQILSSLQYNEIENIMLYVDPTINLLNTEFTTAYNNYLSFKQMIDKLCFSLFICAICLLFVFVWIPYLGALIKKIWMTKGVLNMIPIDVIMKHEKLRQAFTAGDILSAVK